MTLRKNRREIDRTQSSSLKIEEVRARREAALIPEDVADRRAARAMRIVSFALVAALTVFLVLYAVIAGDVHALYGAGSVVGTGSAVWLSRLRRSGD